MVELSSCLWLPEEDFTDDLRERLTVKVYRLDGTSETVEGFRTDRDGYVGLPRVFGLKLISNCDYEDLRAEGHKVKFKKQVALYPEQEPLVEAMMTAAETRTDFITEAQPGKGKTVCGLAVVQKLGRSAIIVVDQENLMDQWVDRCVEHLGMAKEDVGIVRGPRLDYKGKAITVCMMQTITRRHLPEDFYNAFGVAIFDECHTAGAPTFSRALLRFSARTRFGLSATPERKDALKKVIAWNLGTVDARLSELPGRSSVYVIEQEGVYSWRVNNSKMTGAFVNELADDARRNLTIVQAVKWLYESGRDVLVIGDRIEHLCSLMALAEASGIPKHEMGIYAKSRTVFQFEKDPRPPRKPENVEKGAEYTPVRLALVQKTIPKKMLLEVKNRARVLWASYGIMMKGVDMPRLSAGVDATPRSEATQVLGRTLRTAPGKLRPIWATIADVNSFRSLYQLVGRLPDYEQCNAEVFIWDFALGKKRLDVREYRRELKDRIAMLRQSQITTSLDGSYTLTTLATPNDSGNILARRIARNGR